jgi:uncharacterized protein YbjT (DUF2867 family)
MILVVNGTGMLGSRLVYRLLEEGKPVRSFVRPGSNYHPLEAAGAQIVFGDLRQPETFPAALEGVERVIASATAPLSERHIPEAVWAVDGQGMMDFVDACRQADVKQFIYLSFNGVEVGSPIPLAHAKASVEQHLSKSGMTYTILKPEKFMEVWIGFLLGAQLQEGPQVKIAGSGEVPLAFVALENVADLALGVLGHPEAANAVLPLCAPKKYAYREITRQIGELTGAPIEVESIGPGESIPGLPQLVTDMWSVQELAGPSTLDTRRVADAFGLQMIEVEDALKQIFSVPVR